MSLMVKNPHAQAEDVTDTGWIVRSWEDPLEEEMATHFSILPWRIPWTEEPCRLQPTGEQRARHSGATKHSTA